MKCLLHSETSSVFRHFIGPDRYGCVWPERTEINIRTFVNKKEYKPKVQDGDKVISKNSIFVSACLLQLRLDDDIIIIMELRALYRKERTTE